MDYDRVQPQAIEAERSVLGAMMLDSSAVSKMIQHLDYTDFYRESHKTIFKAMVELLKKNEPVDQISIIGRLENSKKLKQVGGAYYITGLVESLPSAANIEHYAMIVQEKSLLRKLIITAIAAQNDSYNNEISINDILDKIEKETLSLRKRLLKGGYKDFVVLEDVLHNVVQEVSERMDSGKPVGLSTGFIDLDKYIGGLQPGFYLIGGRPSMGKTAYALNIARNVAKSVPVGIVSLETSKIRLARRFISSQGKVNSEVFNIGDVSKRDLDMIIKSAEHLRDLPIYIDDTYSTRILDITTRAKILKQTKDIGLLIVDYIQLLEPNQRQENRNLAMTEISRALKLFAEREMIPVIAVAQLNREAEGRMPRLSDLRDSGTLEQDADVVVFVFRPEQCRIKKFKDNKSTEGVAQIYVAKHRDGRTGEFKMTFRKEYVTFEDYREDDRLPF